jgi:hypothetical protein
LQPIADDIFSDIEAGRFLKSGKRISEILSEDPSKFVFGKFTPLMAIQDEMIVDYDTQEGIVEVLDMESLTGCKMSEGNSMNPQGQQGKNRVQNGKKANENNKHEFDYVVTSGSGKNKDTRGHTDGYVPARDGRVKRFKATFEEIAQRLHKTLQKCESTYKWLVVCKPQPRFAFRLISYVSPGFINAWGASPNFLYVVSYLRDEFSMKKLDDTQTKFWQVMMHEAERYIAAARVCCETAANLEKLQNHLDKQRDTSAYLQELEIFMLSMLGDDKKNEIAKVIERILLVRRNLSKRGLTRFGGVHIMLEFTKLYSIKTPILGHGYEARS